MRDVATPAEAARRAGRRRLAGLVGAALFGAAVAAIAPLAFRVEEAPPAPTPPETPPPAPPATFAAPSEPIVASNVSLEPPPRVAPFRVRKVEQPSALAVASASLALTKKGRVLAWSGTLFAGDVSFEVDPLTHFTQIATNGDAMLALDKRADVWAWTRKVPIPKRLPNVTEIRALAVGSGSATFVGFGGAVLRLDFWEKTESGGISWSARSAEWLAAATVEPLAGLDHVIAVSSRGRQNVALRKNGTVWFWGESARMSGAGSTFARPVQVEGVAGVVAIAAGNSHSLALDEDGDVWAWGDNTYRQLGSTTGSLGLLTPTRVPGLPPIKAIAAGMNNGLAIDIHGRVWEWGTEFRGNQVNNSIAAQLAYAPRMVEGLPKAQLVGSNGQASYAFAGNELWTWGTNEGTDYWFPEHPRPRAGLVARGAEAVSRPPVDD